jgi:putative MFS transporter
VRGRSVALVHAAAFTAIPAGFFLAGWLGSTDWWLLLVIGSLGALLTWYFRRRLPESPRWLAATGRSGEAGRILAGMERAIAQETGQPLPEVSRNDKSVGADRKDGDPRAVVQRSGPFRELWSPRYRRRTLLLMAFHLLQTIGYYGFFHWMTKLLVDKGFAGEAFQMSLVATLLAPVGPLLGVLTSERWQRKWLIVMLTTGVSVLMIGFGLALDPIGLIVLAAGCVVGLNWFSAVFHVYQAELFPTSSRATGVGFTYAWSRVSMVGLNLVMPGIIATSFPAAFMLMAGSMLAVAALVACFGPLTNSRSLEESAAGEMV